LHRAISGRRYLQRHSERWDVIAIDAYYSDSIPFHLTTREFLELVRTRLAPGGVVVSNLIGSLRGRDSQLFRAFHRTYRSVFPTVSVHPVMTRNDRRPEDLRNIILVASESAAPGRAFLVQRWRGVRAKARTAPDLTRAIRDRYEAFVPAADVPVLTDDYAPTDALLLN
jgi:spermidine synthase